jgi:hypothetical protein
VGTIARLVGEKSVLPADAAHAIAVERARRLRELLLPLRENARLGLRAAVVSMPASRSPPLLDFLFAVHERVRPFHKFLRWELERRPFADPPSAGGAARAARRDPGTATRRRRSECFVTSRRLHESTRWARWVDGWEPDVAWLRGD